MPRTATAAAALSAHLWAALEYVAKKRSQKSEIVPGSSTKVDLTIEGKIGRRNVSERITGELACGMPSERAASEAAPAETIAALLLERLSDSERYAAMQSIIDAKETTGALPEVAEESKKQAAAWLKRLRSSTTKPVAGAIVFKLA